MIKVFKGLYINNRFFIAGSVLVAIFALGFVVSSLFYVAQVLLILLLSVTLLDIILLFNKACKIEAKRNTANLLSLSDENKIYLHLKSKYALPLKLKVIDEIPDQFQERTFELSLELKAKAEEKLSYLLRPLTRGEYHFGNLNLFCSTFLGLVNRRYVHPLATMVPVYPSVIQMKEFELKAFSKTAHFQGIKKIRRIGHSYEFEQIKTYVKGDDYRSINWKATGRLSQLMVNQYEDERSQQVYSIIDKSRAMNLPFNGLSLLDYSINTSLVISNIALKKHDKVGLITFSDKIGATLKARKSLSQLKRVMEALYRERERKNEANYELLYAATRRLIPARSLIFLYTNFESQYALERVLPTLRSINRFHLLVVMFFENTEILDYSRKDALNIEEIYNQTIADKFVSEKQHMVQKLKQYGIQAILTRPENLSLNTVNKYLELKARGLI